MATGRDDPRKLFILTTAGNYFSVDAPASPPSSGPLDNFLDDGNELLLTVNRQGDELQFSNKVIILQLLLNLYKERLTQK